MRLVLHNLIPSQRPHLLILTLEIRILTCEYGGNENIQSIRMSYSLISVSPKDDFQSQQRFLQVLFPIHQIINHSFDPE
jgi:hypothetical protein